MWVGATFLHYYVFSIYLLKRGKQKSNVMENVRINMESYVINIPKVDFKRLKGIAKAMGWEVEKNEYYESSAFYKDIEMAEEDIANGKGKSVSSVEELSELLS